jgi:regulator of RNase E activity RraA
VLADESGVLVLRPSDVEAVAQRALGMQEREITTLKRIHAGEKLGDISGATRQIEETIKQAATR